MIYEVLKSLTGSDIASHTPRMAFPKAEIERLDGILTAYLERTRPPASVETKIGYGFSISGQSVQLNVIRPRWKHPEQKMVSSFAKATYVTTRNLWKVYWMRADLKWHRYPAAPSVSTLEDFLAVVSEDVYGCFRG